MTHTLNAMSNLVAGGQRETLPRLVDPDAGDPFVPDVGDDVPIFPGEARGATEADVVNYKGSLSWGGHANGYIPSDQLAAVEGSLALEPNAAKAFRLMVADAAAEGVTLSITGGYRSYQAQVDLRTRKGHLVSTATPGHSIHGWGRAIDVASGPARDWVQRNGARYGWVWPKWAQRQGTKQWEPWHFEYRRGK